MKKNIMQSLTGEFSTTITNFEVPRYGADQPGDPLPIPTLTVVLHPDVTRIGDRLLMSELLSGGEVGISRQKPEFSNSPEEKQALLDPYLSRKPFWICPRDSHGLELRRGVCRSKISVNGVVMGECFRISPAELTKGMVIEVADRIVLLLHIASPDVSLPQKRFGMVGNSLRLNRALEEVSRVADLKLPVLVRGESGTGKELISRAIHLASPRFDQPFVCVNLSAIPPSLAATELFGSARGAFTGSTQRQLGFFRKAHGGTLFLDEVGEAPVEVQIMLLRVLETHEIIPVGSQEPVAVDVRLITATDANLEEMVHLGGFRGPLYHRLSGYELHLPPLRERREDIGLLFLTFLRDQLAEIGELARLQLNSPNEPPWIPARVMTGLCLYDWPGNVRELRNITRQLVIANRGHQQLRLTAKVEQMLAHVDSDPERPSNGEKSTLTNPSGKRMTAKGARRKPADIGEVELLAALEEARWDLNQASKLLNIARSSIYVLIQRSDKARTVGDLDAETIRTCYKNLNGNLDQMVQELKVSKKALKRRVKELRLI